MTNTVAILIPAAGFGRRMRGADKLLLEVDGIPLLRRSVMRALDTGSAVVVTLPHDNSDRLDAIADLPATVISVADPNLGMSRSIVLGVQKIKDACDGLMVLPADMPDIETSDMIAVINRFQDIGGQHICRATTQDGATGHPVVFPKSDFPALLALSGDEGGRSVLGAADHIERIPLKGNRALTDLDTPEAWDDWRRNRT